MFREEEMMKIYSGHFKRGLKWGYPVCCILYFQYVHPIIKNSIPEMSEMSNGYVMCPDCIVRNLVGETF